MTSLTARACVRESARESVFVRECVERGCACVLRVIFGRQIWRNSIESDAKQTYFSIDFNFLTASIDQKHNFENRIFSLSRSQFSCLHFKMGKSDQRFKGKRQKY